MQTRVFGVAVLTLLSACQPSTSTLNQRTALSFAATCPLDSGTCIPVSSPATVADACFDDRWIAVLNDAGACPTPEGDVNGSWTVSPLFKREPAWLVPPALRAFCLYEWAPARQGAAPDLASLTRMNGRFARRDPDCAVGLPMAESLATETTWRSLRHQFFDQAGRVDLPSGGQSVRVAIIDAAPTNLTPGPVLADRSGHGQAVGQAVHELACSSDAGVCPTKVVTHLALPLVSLKRPDPVHGGRFGYQSQLALAIHEAVAEWRLFNALGGPQHRRLVLNLSVGWEPTFGGDFTTLGDLPAPVRAVHAALVHARCQGALPIVAAGNDSGGSPAPVGPLFPAAWEQRPAPDAAQCAAVEFANYSPAGLLAPPTPNDYQPLVYSVSGIRGDGASLANARIEGQARLVAPAAHVSVMTSTGGPTSTMTGTSLSAAVVSASAAAAWSFRSELPASTVMALVWAGALQASSQADYCLGGDPCPIPIGSPRAGVRRVSVCGAIAAACATASGSCPTTPITCPPVSLAAISVTDAEVSLIARNAATLTAGPSGVITPAPSVCGPMATFDNESPVFPNTVCANRQYPGLGSRPWNDPQPGSNPCPACILDVAQQRLVVSLDPQLLSLGLLDATLKVGDDYTPLDVARLKETPEVIIDGLKVDPFVDQATLVFKVEAPNDDFSTESELIIKP